MSSLVHLTDFRAPQDQRKARKRVYFDRAELMDILNLYSQKVASGVWRDYAIDHGPGAAMFSMFRSSFEHPLFAIIKQPGARQGDYLLVSGRQKLAQARTLREVLDALRERAESSRPLHLVRQ